MSEAPETLVDVMSILRQWDEENSQPTYDPVPTLTTLAEIIESETEAYMKMDPDPFDERHPCRAYPSCSLGYTLKLLFKKEQFMTKLVNDYLRDNYYARLGSITRKNRDVRKLNIAACRLMLDITPGLETAAVFEMPTNNVLVQRLFSWAEKSPEPLQTYATGLLATAMEVQEIAVVFREQNLKLVPLMLERLLSLQLEASEEKSFTNNIRPFAHLGNSDGESSLKFKKDSKGNPVPSTSKSNKVSSEDNYVSIKSPIVNGLKVNSEESQHETRKPRPEGMMSPPLKTAGFNTSDCSNSSWAEMETYVIGNIQMHPLTLATRQLFILKYLTPMGEYQEFLSHVFEKNALELILQFINLRETKNSRLSFEALKYLAALLCHKKFSIEFINVNGLQRLLEVPRPSIAATGVSICLYYLAYCEDAMERVCLLPQRILSDLVRYSLWLLECSHDSGRCHATMFFGLSFQFRVILEEFDAQDGLRKLYNVISILPILSVDNNTDLITEDEECSARQIVRHVCVALKRYFEAHLYIRSEQVKRAHFRDNLEHSKLSTTLPSYKACKSSPEDIKEQLNILLEYMSFRAQWAPVDNLLRLGGITLLLQIIAFTYEWNYPGRGETVRSVLDVLRVCSVMPKVLMTLCSNVDLPDDNNMMGINVILGASEGEIVIDPEVQRAALQVIITCVCAPVYRVGGVVARYSSGGSNKKRTNLFRSSEEVIEKVWECFRTTNGIMVLLNLIQTKMPITDADSIRGLACQALAGLARSETVRQIISKLALFTTGQLQNLMRDPILQDRRQEHVIFQKYALELLERVSGKRKPKNELEPSLSNIHRANVVAQTRIQFNDRDLLQLIHQHLQSHGYIDSAETLKKEAGLLPIKPQQPQIDRFLSPFTYQQRVTPTRARNQRQTPKVEVDSIAKPTGPIKLNIGHSSSSQKKVETKMPTTPLGRSLEKKTHYRVTDISQKPKEPNVTLDSIITEYLTNQHALCKNPMSTCPQFTLFEPHKCPDPKPRNRIPTNFAVRHSRNIRLKRLDQRLIHSKFCCVHIFRYGDDNAFFTCCDFYGRDKYVIIGSHQGEVKLFNLQTGAEVSAHQCHETYISQVQCSRTNSLLLTSSTWRRPLSACWNLKDLSFEKMFEMSNEDYVEFDKLDGTRIIGTHNVTATIYDVGTGKLISTLTPTLSNQYTKNKATFSPTCELVLSDGVLWDVNGGKEIHKFDKLNQTLSGVFHPSGLEIVSNTEVWDLRTFHLLRTVPALDQSEVLFSPPGNTIYSVTVEREIEENSQYENSFKTLDAYDYTSIATIDVKKSIYDLACNTIDTQIALVENQGMFDSVQESIVKIYDIGRSRTTDDEPEEDDDDDDDDDIDESDGSGSDDDQQNDSLPLDYFEESFDNSDHSDDGEGGQGNSNGDDDEDDDDDDEDFDEEDFEMDIHLPSIDFEFQDAQDSDNSAS